jgi:hypothetical protein
VVNGEAGKVYRVWFCIPKDFFGAAELLDITRDGFPSFKAEKTGSRMWIAISPMVPHP